ncbi:MAG TPA: surface-adhesin E family protein [Caulobacter sp.]|nr:surface-adhesin E family protein [Caulobacter sp.]
MRLALLALLPALAATAVAAQPPALPIPPAPHFETGQGVSLPTGRLQLVSGTRGAAYFIDLDRTARSGDVVTYWTYGVYVPGHSFNGKLAVQEVAVMIIDCGDRTVRTLGVSAFDESGAFVIGLPADPAPEPIKPRSAHEFQAKVLCDGIQLPPQNIFKGHAAGLAAARAHLGRTS